MRLSIYLRIIPGILVCLVGVSCSMEEPGNVKNASAVRQVLAGKRTTANAAWWGFDESDATAALQSAIDSGAKKVLVPNMGKDWIVRPVTLADSQEIVFEPGVVLTAKKGEFKGSNDSVLNAVGKKAIKLTGNSAVIRMQKNDYMSENYTKAEWRMAVNLRSCSDVAIEGFELRDSGGDGIYLGVSGEQPHCENIRIRNVVFDNNYRQGISVISCDGLLMENCTIRNTSGTAPEAGIDLEPNHENERLSKILIRNCRFENNRGFGIQLYANALRAGSEKLSITFENCRITSAEGGGIFIGAIRDNGPGGFVEFRNCDVDSVAQWGFMASEKSALAAIVRFTNCSWRATAFRSDIANPSPFVIRSRVDRDVAVSGGIEFGNCSLEDSIDRPFITTALDSSGFYVAALAGSIRIANPHGVRMELGKGAKDNSLAAIRE